MQVLFVSLLLRMGWVEGSVLVTLGVHYRWPVGLYCTA